VRVTVEVPTVSHANVFAGILNATGLILGCLVSGCTLRAVCFAVEPPVVDTVPPTQVVLALPETTTPVGNVSVSGAVRVAGVVPTLLKVMVRVELPPILMVDGLKLLPSVGATSAGALTVKVATAGAALLPLLVTKAPTANELM
jgi:hypothetical protein